MQHVDLWTAADIGYTGRPSFLMLKKVVSLLFFLSGSAGLIYEVVWAKYLALFLGSTAHAHTIVLGTFMGGLALGYFVFGRLADRSASALRLYGWMEIAIGLSAALFIPILGWLGALYLYLAGQFGLGSIWVSAFRFLLAVFLLLPPTMLMGGTLPILSRFVVKSLGEVEQGVGWLYFLNSLGAVGGSLLAGFVLVPGLGLNLAIIAAVALNLLVGVIALALRPWENGQAENAASPPVSDPPGNELYTPMQVRIAVFGIALSGGAALIYEIAWIRLLSLVLGSSTYSFSLMLAAFIAGIALGSFTVSRRWAARWNPYLLFALAELGVALSIILTLPFYERLPFYFALMASLITRAPETFWLYESLKFLLCFLVMLLPTFFLGMTLPLVSQVATRSLRRLGEKVGQVFSANTVGTLAGAVAAGLLLLPLLGIKTLIEAGVVINWVAGASALAAGPLWAWRRKGAVLLSTAALFLLYLYLFPDWDRQLLSSGSFRMRKLALSTTYREFRKMHQEKLLFYRDGANMTVGITEAPDNQIVLRVNGKPDATSRGDLPTQILLGQVPLLLKPDARRVLVIGLGSGITAGSVLRHPIERLDLVEISPEVVDANRFFSPHNHNALNDPRLKLHVEDGKSFLKLAPQRYDLIISEPSNPWIAGIGNLFSLEFYEDARSRLRPGGLMVQWFQTYEMTDDTLRLLLRTFTASFEHATIWSPLGADILLIGSKEPVVIDFAKSLARFNDPEIRQELARLGINSFATILALQVASDQGTRKAAGRGAVNEDLFPILEYEAPKAFFLGKNSDFLLSHDERRRSRDRSGLYFARYLKGRSLGTPEIKDIATYYLTYRSLPGLDLARVFVALWLKRAPGDARAHWAMVYLEGQRGNSDTALKEVRYLLTMDPDNREYLDAAARLELEVYLSRRSVMDSVTPDRALGYLRRLLSFADAKKDGIYRRMAHVYAVEKDYNSAVRYLAQAAAYSEKQRGTFQPDGLWLEAAGMALEMDDLAAALSYIEKALAHNPNNTTANREQRRLHRMAERNR